MVTNKLTGKFLLSLPSVHVYKLLMNNNIARFPNRFWVGEDALVRASEITVHLIEGVLKWHKDEVREQMSIKIFKDNKLLGMLNSLFGGSPYMAIENAYPDKYEAWELANVPMNYWTPQTVKNISSWIAKNGAKTSLQATKKILRLSQSNMAKRGLVKKKLSTTPMS